mmetsp:Transcript_5376/g.9025  ORF Transcript_5376/g.9025 Transcript_5376/m.9025 type:complete len:118 (+) Transcript_5376:1544-1897(+)
MEALEVVSNLLTLKQKGLESGQGEQASSSTSSPKPEGASLSDSYSLIKIMHGVCQRMVSRKKELYEMDRFKDSMRAIQDQMYSCINFESLDQLSKINFLWIAGQVQILLNYKVKKAD